MSEFLSILDQWKAFLRQILLITLQQLTKNPRSIRSTDVVKDVNRIPDELLEARTVQELTFVESLGEEVVDVNMEVAVNAVETLSSDRLLRDS